MPYTLDSGHGRTARRSMTLLSIINLPHAIKLRALCGANLVTQHPSIWSQPHLHTAPCGAENFEIRVFLLVGYSIVYTNFVGKPICDRAGNPVCGTVRGPQRRNALSVYTSACFNPRDNRCKSRIPPAFRNRSLRYRLGGGCTREVSCVDTP